MNIQSFIWSPKGIMYLKLLIFKKNYYLHNQFLPDKSACQSGFCEDCKSLQEMLQDGRTNTPKLIIYASLTFLTQKHGTQKDVTVQGLVQVKALQRMAPARFEPWNQNCLLMIHPKTTFHQEVCISSLVKFIQSASYIKIQRKL